MINEEIKHEDYSVDFASGNANWSEAESESLRQATLEFDRNRTPERRLRNQLLSVKYRMEEYLAREDISEKDLKTHDIFLKEFLGVLNMSLRKFSEAIEIQDSNLRKYLKGDRAFNFDLAMKFGKFFHTPPDYWLRLEIKNMLIIKDKISKEYDKYDYEKFIVK